MKLSDLLSLVGDGLLADRPWGTTLIALLNQGVAEHACVTTTDTGYSALQVILARGNAHAMDLLEREFDTATGSLTEAEEDDEPARRSINSHRMIGYIAGAILAVIGLLMALSVSKGGDVAAQKDMLETIVAVLADVTRSMLMSNTPI